MFTKSLLALGLIAIAGCGSAPAPDTAPEAAEPVPTEATETKQEETTITKADYDAISEGMTLAEVEELIGPGEEVSSTEFQGITTTVVQWTNDDFSNLVLTVQNGEVVSKAQSMLK